METRWLRESLFAGMTSIAFKLGTVLTLGWFWARVSGCSLLYRGSSMEDIDFSNILAVSDINASQVQPPGYAPHDSSQTYFYVVRRANNCGAEEHTLSAAAKVSIDTDGELASPQPNGIFSIKAVQVDGGKVQLVWFYCPLEQKSQPISFRIYYDNQTGQIDYENPISTLGYSGRKFYSYQTDMLGEGKYIFAVRAVDAAGAENNSLSQAAIQINVTNPDVINILNTEIV